ncbi:AMP-binding protein [Variovorax sp. OV329]|uniref:AMP-binding protein n=1 Tax=Variovorax sp. OV329 TaxID=1882825 RepID=UPI0008E67FEF|nr:AMP-binding protein [Variovorax sp. OV329]SFN43736.1 feruloyl-CoA synthase [Variovorax sp. OV329]
MSYAPQGSAQASYRDSKLLNSAASHQRLADGTLLMKSLDEPGVIAESSFSEFVAQWAQSRGAQVALAERNGPDSWRTVDWAAFHRQMLSVAAALLELGLSQTRPLMILSGNSIELAVLTMAADYVGIPTAPVTPAAALMSQEFTRLIDMHALVEPAAVFVQSLGPFAKALEVLGTPAAEIIAVQGSTAGQITWQSLIETPMTPQRRAAVQAAHQAIDAERDVARIFFTSGSTGVPKGVPLHYRNAAAMIGQIRYMHRPMLAETVVMLDWLPWSHAFGAVANLGRLFVTGGSFYIDDGRPLPALFGRTVQNLREVSPSFYANVPAAWAMLSAELERDEALAHSFFSRLNFAGYGGASLARDVWKRFQDVAVRTVGQRIVFASGFGATETTGLGSGFTMPGEEVDNIGLPGPGVELKLVPLEGEEGRYEIRTRGPHVFPGYLKRPDLSTAAFDDEGYYCLGDAVRLADPQAPEAGLRYAGRCVEDFKLGSGTWVRTGAVRLGLVESCAPLLADAVICGHDRDKVAALAWPNVAQCRSLAPELAEAPVETLIRHPLVIGALRAMLRTQTGPGSQQVYRVMLMAEAPSPDAYEIADKGYVNQAITRQRRAHLIDVLYADRADAAIARID